MCKILIVVISVTFENSKANRVFRKHLVEPINATARDGIKVGNTEEECSNDAIECGAKGMKCVMLPNAKLYSFVI